MKQIDFKEDTGGTLDSVNNTLFIIGAGAHCDYNFPTGEGLKEIIRQIHFGNTGEKYNDVARVVYSNILDVFNSKARVELLSIYKNEWDIYSRESDVSFEKCVEKLTLDFSTEFLESSSNTIDEFLTLTPKWGALGKLLITIVIRYFERKDPLKKCKSSWIQMVVSNYLRNDEPIEKLLKNFPNVITFNYDRLLEEIIYKRILIMYKDKELAETFVEKLNIHHVYGKVGDLRFDNLVNEKAEDLFIASKNIQTIGSERNVKYSNNQLMDLIFRNHSIYFLGFGFDQQNMNLLFGNENALYNSFVSRFFSTNIGLQNYIKEIARNYIHEDYDIVGFDSKESYDCTRLLQNFLKL